MSTALPLMLLIQLGISVLLHVSNAETINCTITENVGRTLYSIPEFKGTGCFHSWADSTGNVLANNEGKNETVTKNTNWMFEISGCFEEIRYRRECFPEGPQEATCTTNCSETKGIQKKPEIKRHYWITIALFSFSSLIVIAVVLILCCKVDQTSLQETIENNNNSSRDAELSPLYC